MENKKYGMNVITAIVFAILLLGFVFIRNEAKQNEIGWLEQAEITIVGDERIVRETAQSMYDINSAYVKSANAFEKEIQKGNAGNINIVVAEGNRLDMMLEPNAQKMREFKIPKAMKKENRQKLEYARSMYIGSYESMAMASAIGTQMMVLGYSDYEMQKNFLANVVLATQTANEAHTIVSSVKN